MIPPPRRRPIWDVKARIGDLIRMKDCPPPIVHPQGVIPCMCDFCRSDSSRIGVVIGTVPLTHDSWIVQFDFGEWRLEATDITNGDVEIVNAS